MNRLITILICCGSVLTSFSQNLIFENEFIKCVYEQSNGRFNGDYTSYYKNGQTKAQGKFSNNNRTGKWTIWDSTGNIKIQRIYSDSYNYKTTFPKQKSNDLVKLLNISQYQPEYNSDGYLDYIYLKERMVVWSKRIWRYIENVQNPLLFDQNKLFDLINKAVFKGDLKAYAPTNDDFRIELPVNNIDTSYLKVIGYKIKEDIYFDNERFISESRIIGICPVVMNMKNNKTYDLYWIYFPMLRKHLATISITGKTIPSNIKNIDDLFFYRYFYGQIIKEESLENQQVSDSKQSQKIEIGLIEKEHDLWTEFNR